MSLQRVLLAAFILTAAFATPAAAQDFTCHPAREHCVAAARDNFTFYVDTDGSMNADSGRNVCCGGGSDSYLDVVRKELKDLADNNDNGGSCKTDDDPSKCRSRGCDGIRLGIGYFGDDSAMDSGDGLIAYEDEQAGEDKRNQVKNSIDAESAGNIGAPGIETLSCPPNGPGQSDTITCPTNADPQRTRIWCPPNGGVQVDEIGCPFDGTAMEYRIACPKMAVKRTGHVQPTTAAPFTFYDVLVGGTLVSFMTTLTPAPVDIAIGLYNDAIGNPAITSTYTVTRVGTDVRFEHQTPGVDFSMLNAGCFSCNIGLFPPVDISGLPSTPAPPYDFGFDLNGTLMEYTGGASETTDSVCTGLAAEVNSAGMDINASVSSGVLILRSTLAGKPFTVANVDASLNDSAPYGEVIANLPGVPGDPEAAKTFDFDINGTTVEYDHAGAGETALNICNQLIAEVNASGEDVNATLLNAGLNADGKPDYRIQIASTVMGQNFTISNVDSDLRDNGTTTAGGAGLPGDPGDGYVFDFLLNGTTISATGNLSSNTASVCADLAASVNGSGEPVTAVSWGTYILLSPVTEGELFTVSAVDPELMHDPYLPGTTGLPGTPGAGYTYSWDWTDYTGATTSINVPSPGAPTQVTVCQAIQAQLDAMPEFAATLNGSQTVVTVTAQIPGLTWTFSNMDPYLGPHTSSLNGDLPNNPPPFNQYDFRINGTDVNWTDDGTPTQAEVCAGVTARINTVAGGDVSATHDGSTITIVGNTAAAFDITSVESDLSPHIIVQEAGLGPSAFGQVSSRINADLNITTRVQNAVVVTHRGPEDFADFSLAVDELCAKRDDTNAPAITHFIGVDVNATEKNLMDILAAAGGSGSCSGGIDPCAVANTTLANSVTMAPLVNCGGMLSANPWTIDDRIDDLKRFVSCTFALDVPPTYPDGIAPANTNATRVTLTDICHSHDPLVDFQGDPTIWTDFTLYMAHCFGWSEMTTVQSDGWTWTSSGDRKEITFEAGLCEWFRDGRIEELETHVGCLCANQGEECTAPFVDPMGNPVPCKSPTHGRCTNPGGLDPTVCTGGTATGECSDDGYCLQACTAEQLDAMRCATGVYLCDEVSGTETCTAGGDNAVPEICNGIDDDCDGLVDNMSNNPDDAFAGYDTQGRDCNGANACTCEDGWRDVPSATTDLQDHLDSYSGGCECGEQLQPATPAMSLEVGDGNDPIASDEPLSSGESSGACAVATGDARSDFMLLGLLGLFLVRRRRRRRA